MSEETKQPAEETPEEPQEAPQEEAPPAEERVPDEKAEKAARGKKKKEKTYGSRWRRRSWPPGSWSP